MHFNCKANLPSRKWQAIAAETRMGQRIPTPAVLWGLPGYMVCVFIHYRACRDESVVGNEHIGTGEIDNHNLNQRAVGDADSMYYYFRLSACTKYDLPTANYTRTRDVEAQTIETGAQPTFILYHFSDGRELFWSFIGSLIVWWIQSILWYLQRVVG